MARGDSGDNTPGSSGVVLLGWFAAGWLVQAGGLKAFFVGDDFDFLGHAANLRGFGDAVRLVFWGEWEPVWYVTWYLDYRLWGLDPTGYHATNITIFAATVAAIFWLVRRAWPGQPFLAWGTTALFATNPLHDEAVTYLAARGHTLALLLSVISLAVLVHVPAPATPGRRYARELAAWLMALLAGLAKESALVLPLWGAALIVSQGPQRGTVRAALRGGLILASAGLTSLAIRGVVVGLGSDKLTAAVSHPGRTLAGLVEYLPSYALLGALPLPFGVLDHPDLLRWSALGWAVLFAAIAGAGFALGRSASPVAAAMRVYALGLVIALSALGPVFWADLALRRRYLYAPSLGVALMAATLLSLAWRRWPRPVAALLGLLALLGAVATVQRNALYHRSGEVARNLIQTVRDSGAVAGRPPAQPVLVTLPRAYGGDFVSGAYLFHHTDVAGALWNFTRAPVEVEYALKCYHADDYSATLTPIADDRYRLQVAFRSRRAFDAARRRDPETDRRGDSIRATRVATDEQRRTLTYDLRLEADFRRGIRKQLLLYSDGKFNPVATDPSAPEP